MDFDADWLGADPPTDYKSAATDVVRPWKAPGTDPHTIRWPRPRPPRGTGTPHRADVHGIDTAAATAQERFASGTQQC